MLKSFTTLTPFKLDEAQQGSFLSYFKCLFSWLPIFKRQQELSFLQNQYQRKRDEKEIEESHAPTIIAEKDFITNETLEVKLDVYSLVLVSILTDEVSPQTSVATFSACIKAFFIQMFLSFFLANESRSQDKFQPFNLMHTALRLVATVLLHMVQYSQLQYTIKFMTYLKRLREDDR